MKKQIVNLGGDRLGSGSMMDVTLSPSGKSTHDLTRVWRSSMTTGTLVPFITEVLLPGDEWDVELETKVRTHPTTGPLFGTFKMQLDMFKVPMRYYIAALHNNFVGVGTKMDQIYMPQMLLAYQKSTLGSSARHETANLDQVAKDSLLAYLGISALGNPSELNEAPEGSALVRKFWAIPALAMADIYKMYYANLQEGIGAIMGITPQSNSFEVYYMDQLLANGALKYTWPEQFFGVPMVAGNLIMYGGESTTIYSTSREGIDNLYINIGTSAATAMPVDVLDSTQWAANGILKVEYPSLTSLRIYWQTGLTRYVVTNTDSNAVTWTLDQGQGETVQYTTFPLENIDNMRMALLQAPTNAPYVVNDAVNKPGYNSPYREIWGGRTRPDGTIGLNADQRLCGLFIRTHVSDRFQNWLDTELIDGAAGVTISSAVDVSAGTLTMDALNLAQKTYELLNRIVAAGNSYASFLKAVWNVDKLSQVEMPMYIGGASGEIAFDEVVSTSEVGNVTGTGPSPLGSLAGRGVEVGGKTRSKIKVIENEEPAILMGIVSLVPRIDYSQGNEWWTRLKTIDELHKPQYDGIGFQELITDEMVATDTVVTPTTGYAEGAIQYYSAGKQPAWIQYQTAVNKVFGSFAYPDEEMFMTLVRLYGGETTANVDNITTYINPAMFLQAFATSNRTDQHFWLQIRTQIKARRLMSATAIPNL